MKSSLLADSKMFNELIKSILFETILVMLFVRNIVMLKKALTLRCDIKADNTEKVKARITFTRPTGNRSYMARAVYTVGGSEVKGSSVCAVGYRLRRGDENNVIVGKTDSSVFALDEQHTKDAVLTWTVLGILNVLGMMFFAVDIVFEIIK